LKGIESPGASFPRGKSTVPLLWFRATLRLALRVGEKHRFSVDAREPRPSKSLGVTPDHSLCSKLLRASHRSQGFVGKRLDVRGREFPQGVALGFPMCPFGAEEGRQSRVAWNKTEIQAASLEGRLFTFRVFVFGGRAWLEWHA